MSQSIGTGITGEKKSWGGIFRTEVFAKDEVVQVSFTINELARMLLFASDGLFDALRVLSYEAEEMEKEKAAKETPA